MHRIVSVGYWAALLPDKGFTMKNLDDDSIIWTFTIHLLTPDIKPVQLLFNVVLIIVANYLARNLTGRFHLSVPIYICVVNRTTVRETGKVRKLQMACKTVQVA